MKSDQLPNMVLETGTKPHKARFTDSLGPVRDGFKRKLHLLFDIPNSPL